MGWTDTLLTTAPQEREALEPVPETPVIEVPTAPEIPVQEPPDFEIECALVAAGANKNEVWCINETFKEKGITPDSNLAWLWVQKLRNRERL